MDAKKGWLREKYKDITTWHFETATDTIKGNKHNRMVPSLQKKNECTG